MTNRSSALVLALGLFGLIGLSAAQAQTTPRSEQREVRQEARIDQGVASGQLTRPETARLNAGQARVDRIQARVGADSQVTAAERVRLQKAQNRSSRMIYQQKNDRQTAPTRSSN